MRLSNGAQKMFMFGAWEAAAGAGGGLAVLAFDAKTVIEMRGGGEGASQSVLRGCGGHSFGTGRQGDTGVRLSIARGDSGSGGN